MKKATINSILKILKQKCGKKALPVHKLQIQAIKIVFCSKENRGDITY